jgi:hypothetical protein
MKSWIQVVRSILETKNTYLVNFIRYETHPMSKLNFRRTIKVSIRDWIAHKVALIMTCHNGRDGINSYIHKNGSCTLLAYCRILNL